MTRTGTIRKAALAWSILAILHIGAAQGFGGTFETRLDTGTFRLQFAAQGGRLSGHLEGPGVYLQLEGWVENGVGVGVASSADGQLGFEAIVEGDRLGIWFYEVVNGVVLPETEIEVLLTRVAGPAEARQPAAQPPAPGGSPVIATGRYASLTHDDAVAFIEALEFVLAQIGYAYSFTDVERAQALQAVAQSYPGLAQDEQVVLSQARAVWERVQANWSSASSADQREFALGVLVLAFGEQTVAQWVGGGSGGGGGGTCTTFEDCTSSLADGQTLSDTMNAQSCWAAAGCESFDPSTGTFDYGDY